MSWDAEEVKLVDETLDLSVDFLSSLRIVEVLVSCATTVVVQSGLDPDPASMMVGVPTRVGSVVTQKLTGGVPGVIYSVNISAGTSLANIIVKQIPLAVLSHLPFQS